MQSFIPQYLSTHPVSYRSVLHKIMKYFEHDITFPTLGSENFQGYFTRLLGNFCQHFVDKCNWRRDFVVLFFVSLKGIKLQRIGYEYGVEVRILLRRSSLLLVLIIIVYEVYYHDIVVNFNINFML